MLARMHSNEIECLTVVLHSRQYRVPQCRWLTYEQSRMSFSQRKAWVFDPRVTTRSLASTIAGASA
jgi:hypothetical protein